jgi:uncharacterized membrane protein required for colicin V production
MILSIAIGLILLLAFQRGHHFGLLRSVFRLLSRVVVFVLGILLAHRLGAWLSTAVLENLGGTFAASNVPDLVSGKATQFLASGLAFALISGIGYWVLNSIERSLKFFNKIPLLGTLNQLLGGLVYLLLAYVTIFFVLQVTQTLAIDWYHKQLVTSTLAQWMLDKTPYLSQQIYAWWVVQ